MPPERTPEAVTELGPSVGRNYALFGDRPPEPVDPSKGADVLDQVSDRELIVVHLARIFAPLFRGQGEFRGVASLHGQPRDCGCWQTFDLVGNRALPVVGCEQRVIVATVPLPYGECLCPFLFPSGFERVVACPRSGLWVCLAPSLDLGGSLAVSPSCAGGA
jgi:hypothetical protein